MPTQSHSDILQTYLLSQVHTTIAELHRQSWPVAQGATAWGVYGPYRVTISVSPVNGQAESSKIKQAMAIFEADPSLSIREVARRVPCSPSLLSRSTVFQRFHETFVRRARHGTKFEGQADAVDGNSD